VSAFIVEPAAGPLVDDAWAEMTFPLYRPLLGCLESQAAGQGGAGPVAWIAREGSRSIGLLLAELPSAARPSAEVLSVFVAEAWRRQGVAGALFDALECGLADRGVGEIVAVYMTGKPGTAALERLFAARGYSDPVLRKLIVQCTPEQVARTDWYAEARLPVGAEIFPWEGLTGAESDDLRQSQATSPWIPDVLQPWACGPSFDPPSSVGMRLDGAGDHPPRGP